MLLADPGNRGVADHDDNNRESKAADDPGNTTTEQSRPEGSGEAGWKYDKYRGTFSGERESSSSDDLFHSISNEVGRLSISGGDFSDIIERNRVVFIKSNAERGDVTVDNNAMLTKILEEIEKKETVRVKKVETDNDGENSSAGVVRACSNGSSIEERIKSNFAPKINSFKMQMSKLTNILKKAEESIAIWRVTCSTAVRQGH